MGLQPYGCLWHTHVNKRRFARCKPYVVERHPVRPLCMLRVHCQSLSFFRWGPSNSTCETISNETARRPSTAVSWGEDRIDVFSLSGGDLLHQSFNGTAWLPSANESDTIASGFLPGFGNSSDLAATSWGTDRLDVFGLAWNGSLLHKYWNGSSWQPEGNETENLGGTLFGSPVAVSWGQDRNDVFAISQEEQIVHMSWNGTNRSEWETILGESSLRFSTPPTVVSWAPDRLDVFAINSSVNASLWHTAWNGSQWLPWEDMGNNTVGVDAVSWGPGRIDLYALNQDLKYHHKFWNGTEWNPDVTGWYDKGDQQWQSVPTMLSWGANHFEIFGVDAENDLRHQTWSGDGWYPAADHWENLGGKWESNKNGSFY